MSYKEVPAGRSIHVAPKRPFPKGIQPVLKYPEADKAMEPVMHLCWGIFQQQWDRNDHPDRCWPAYEYWSNSTHFEATRQLYIKLSAPQDQLDLAVAEINKLLQ